ncbi:hypothetical protein Agub_g6517 [Astrephomene gubernaculifera]|uniref:GATA-type domain-containing protein n=1 Tax=Astrephomene gubernaculifera TaxID=47775 RepID=A0AAD3DQL1_9CHLO|nr:hypothetical protein Agub_g6517 [Astrephomene gubernaculifera]
MHEVPQRAAAARAGTAISQCAAASARKRELLPPMAQCTATAPTAAPLEQPPGKRKRGRPPGSGSLKRTRLAVHPDASLHGQGAVAAAAAAAVAAEAARPAPEPAGAAIAALHPQTAAATAATAITVVAAACITCGSAAMHRGFTSSDGKRTCHSCCLHNWRELRFYGPVGTRSLEEAGGRICAECGAKDTYKWHRHKLQPLLHTCNACNRRYRKYGRYGISVPYGAGDDTNEPMADVEREPVMEHELGRTEPVAPAAGADEAAEAADEAVKLVAEVVEAAARLQEASEAADAPQPEGPAREGVVAAAAGATTAAPAGAAAALLHPAAQGAGVRVVPAPCQNLADRSPSSYNPSANAVAAPLPGGACTAAGSSGSPWHQQQQGQVQEQQGEERRQQQQEHVPDEPTGGANTKPRSCANCGSHESQKWYCHRARPGVFICQDCCPRNRRTTASLRLISSLGAAVRFNEGGADAAAAPAAAAAVAAGGGVSGIARSPSPGAVATVGRAAAAAADADADAAATTVAAAAAAAAPTCVITTATAASPSTAPADASAVTAVTLASPPATAASTPVDSTTCVACGSHELHRGYVAPGGRFTCHACCLKNKTVNGFYGPAGTTSVQAAGGRGCAQCGTTLAERSRVPHMRRRGLYSCRPCFLSYSQKGTYDSTAPAAGVAAAAVGEVGVAATAAAAVTDAEDVAIAYNAAVGDVAAFAHPLLQPTLGSSLSLPPPAVGGLGEQLQPPLLPSPPLASPLALPPPPPLPPPQQQRKQEILSDLPMEQQSSPQLSGAVCNNAGPPPDAAAVDVAEAPSTAGAVEGCRGATQQQQQQQQQRTGDEVSVVQAVQQQRPDGAVVQALAEAVRDFGELLTTTCEALLALEDAYSDVRLLNVNTVRQDFLGAAAFSPTSPPPPPPSLSRPLRATYEGLCGGDAEMRFRFLADLLLRWLQARVWSAPLALLLGPVAAGAGLDRLGPPPGLDERQQAEWIVSRRGLYGTFSAVASVSIAELIVTGGGWAGADGETAAVTDLSAALSDLRVIPADVTQFHAVAEYLASSLAGDLLGLPQLPALSSAVAARTLCASLSATASNRQLPPVHLAYAAASLHLRTLAAASLRLALRVGAAPGRLSLRLAVPGEPIDGILPPPPPRGGEAPQRGQQPSAVLSQPWPLPREGGHGGGASQTGTVGRVEGDGDGGNGNGEEGNARRVEACKWLELPPEICPTTTTAGPTATATVAGAGAGAAAAAAAAGSNPWPRFVRFLRDMYSVNGLEGASGDGGGTGSCLNGGHQGQPACFPSSSDCTTQASTGAVLWVVAPGVVHYEMSVSQDASPALTAGAAPVTVPVLPVQVVGVKNVGACIG